MTTTKRSAVVDIIAMIFMALFLYTGISKLMDYAVFKEQIATSPLLAPFSRFIAGILPWLEFFVVLLLIPPRWRLKGLYASLVLMILFTGYIIAMLSFNKDIPCSCGGVIELLSWKQHIIFNTIIIALSAIGIHFEREARKDSERKWISIF